MNPSEGPLSEREEGVLRNKGKIQGGACGVRLL